MDLTQLANLGEFIGGVAVLVTLVYLVLQVRQNTSAVLSTTQQGLHGGWSGGAGTALSLHPTEPLPHLIVKARTGDEQLSEEERLRSTTMQR